MTRFVFFSFRCRLQIVVYRWGFGVHVLKLTRSKVFCSWWAELNSAPLHELARLVVVFPRKHVVFPIVICGFPKGVLSWCAEVNSAHLHRLACFSLFCYEQYAPNFARQIFILMTLLKFGSQQAPKSVDPESCHSKKLFCRLFFGENPRFQPFRPKEDPPFIYIVGKLWISAF